MPSAAQATVSTIIQTQEPKEPGSFRRYEFGLSGRAVVPSLVYIRPDDLEHVRMIVGPDAELGDQKYPVHKEQMVFGNLKSLFKSDLVLADKEPTWKYKFDRNLGYAETNPITV